MSNSVSSIPQFGRAWKVTITNANGTVLSFGASTWTPEPLHITFNTYQTIQQAYWYCDVVIYNLNGPTQQAILLQGMRLKLEGGYQSQPYGTIFEGTIFQPLWERENGVDWKLTLRCIVGLIESTNNFIGETIAGGLTQRQIVARMAAACQYPLDASDTDALSTTVQTRSQTYFGQPNDFLQAIADDNDANLWFSNMALHIRQFAVQDTLPTLKYGVNKGLIGTPQQTQEGVEIKVLLDARALLRTQFQLDQSVVIQQLARSVPSYPTILDQSGTYFIGAVRHYGDSRGNDWYSEITGFINAGSLLSLMTQF